MAARKSLEAISGLITTKITAKSAANENASAMFESFRALSIDF